MYLGIEIGGTKLQLAVGAADGSPPAQVERVQVDPSRGASGILEQIGRIGRQLLDRHEVSRIGIGFGGPVDVASGRVTTSHQITGWDGVPLVEWCQRLFGLTTCLDNDCNVAALAEACFGAGRGQPVVFYVTVGTGVGGGLVTDGRLFGSHRPAIAEIGHLRPGLAEVRPTATVESIASGWGIVAMAVSRLNKDRHDMPAASQPSNARGEPAVHGPRDLLARCQGNLDQLTAEMVARAAGDGDRLALEVLQAATRTLGWAIAQVITLIAPQVVVIGGGVSKIGKELFLDPLTREVRRYVFPPLLDSYQIAPAALGDLVVVHGALALAAGQQAAAGSGP
jgi:glucokinase